MRPASADSTGDACEGNSKATNQEICKHVVVANMDTIRIQKDYTSKAERLLREDGEIFYSDKKLTNDSAQTEQLLYSDAECLLDLCWSVHFFLEALSMVETYQSKPL